MLRLSQAGNTTHADIRGTRARVAAGLMPAFPAKEGARAEWKADVRAGTIRLEERDTAGHTTAMKALDRAADGGLTAR